MRARIANDLVLLNLLLLVLVLAILFFPSNVLRIVLGLPAVLFMPGYTLMAALHPRKEAVDNIQRVALSFGLSIAVVPLIGLILNYTIWGITLESVLYSNVAFIVTMSIVAWARRKKFPVEERFGIDFRWRMPGWRGSAWDKALTVFLVVSVIGVAAVAGYVIAKPRIGQQFTEFYILGAERGATDYPGDLVVGQDAEVTLGVINREHRRTDYRLVVDIEGVLTGEIGPVVLEHEEKWEQTVNFSFQRAGENHEVEFRLYGDDDPEPYLQLRLWVDVAE